jgi:hypothetical protein
MSFDFAQKVLIWAGDQRSPFFLSCEKLPCLARLGGWGHPPLRGPGGIAGRIMCNLPHGKYYAV